MGNSGESGSRKSGQQVNYTEPATTRLTDQTYEKFVQYSEQEGVGKSEGLRRLVRSGLDHELEEETEDEEDTPDKSLSDVLLALGAILGIAVAAGYLSGGGNPDQTATYLTVALVGAGLLLRLRNHD